MSRRHFSTIELIVQTFKDSLSRLGSTAVLGLLALLLALGTTMASVSEFHRIESAEQAAVKRGSNTFLVTSRDRSAFSATACEALNSVDGVIAAGGRTVLKSVTVDTAPRTTVKTAAITPGYLRAAWPSLSSSSPLVNSSIGKDVAQATGVQSGGNLRLIQSGHRDVVSIDAVGEATERVEGFDSVVARVASPDIAVIECLIEARPGSAQAAHNLLKTRFDESMLVAPLYELEGVGPTPQQQLSARASLWLPIAAGTFLVVAQLGRLLLRRPDFALYRLLGATHRQVAAMVMVDFISFTAMPLVAGFLMGLIFTSSPRSMLSVEIVAADVSRLAVLGLLGVPFGTLMLATKNPVDLIREG